MNTSGGLINSNVSCYKDLEKVREFDDSGHPDYTSNQWLFRCHWQLNVLGNCGIRTETWTLFSYFLVTIILLSWICSCETDWNI